MRTKVDALVAVSQFLVEHRLVAIATPAGEQGTVLQGVLRVGRLPGEALAGRVGEGPLDAAPRQHRALRPLEENQGRHACLYSIPARQLRLRPRTKEGTLFICSFYRAT